MGKNGQGKTSVKQRIRRKKKMVTVRCIAVNAIDGTIEEVTHEITEEQMEKLVSILDEACGEDKKDDERSR